MNILIIKTQAIGDVLMSLHMIESLKKCYGDIKITWICSNQVQTILSKIDDIEEVISFDEKVLFKGSILERLEIFSQIWKKVILKKFDKVIIGHSDWRYNLFYPFKTRERVSFGKGKYSYLPIGTRYHGVDYCVLSTSEDFVKKNGILFPKVNYNFVSGENKKKVLLFPGGANNILSEQYLRRWPIEYYVQLNTLLKKEGYEVIISGGNSDKWVIDYFPKDIKNFIGKTDLDQTIELINYVDFVVTHDSGPLHMALLLSKTKVISIFGPVLSDARISKNSQNSFVFFNSKQRPECSPCYFGKGFVNCTDNICMKVHKPLNVFNKIQELNIDVKMQY